MSEVIKLVEDVKASMDTMEKKNTEILATIKDSVDQSGVLSKEAVEKANAAAQQVQDSANRIIELEQKLAENVHQGKAEAKTLGQLVIESDNYKAFAAGQTQRMKFVNASTITGQEGSPAVNSDTLVAPERLGGIVPGAFRKLNLRDVIPGGTTSSNAVEYTKEATFTNNAAETAEGATKPETDLTFSLVTANVATIAHFIKASKQVLEDASALQAYIDNRMRFGVEKRIDSQILNGDGTGQNISGITKSGNFTAFTPTTGENALDSINRAIEVIETADYDATGIVLNPADWHAIERIKRGTNDAAYVFGDPSRGAAPVLWGLPVVVSNAMTAGKFLVADFLTAYQYLTRMGTVVEMFEQDSDNVQKNLLTIRAEARGVLLSYVAVAARYGDLTL